MRIGPTFGVSILAPRLRAAADARRVRRGADVARGGDDGASRGALVPVDPEASRREDAPARSVRFSTDAAFLAQLLATAEGLPETRRFRRIEARVGAAVYERAQRGEGLLAPGYLVDVAR
ncbi:MAG: hypothetical protein GX458_21250 [Phyllobacteriaceae bacterium]|nr:hypothetical protein [Phyllobacteriaceae bacterium]